MTIYSLEKILHKDGTERTDGRYPLRKGCIGNIVHLQTEDCMYFQYVKDNNGNDKSGYLRTSIVEAIGECGDDTIIYTMNSIYVLKYIKQ